MNEWMNAEQSRAAKDCSVQDEIIKCLIRPFNLIVQWVFGKIESWELVVEQNAKMDKEGLICETCLI